jgi:hypothetical protein
LGVHKGINEENAIELADQQKKIDTISVEKNTLSNSLKDVVQKYNELKNNRFMWLVEWLEKTFPKKD